MFGFILKTKSLPSQGRDLERGQKTVSPSISKGRARYLAPPLRSVKLTSTVLSGYSVNIKINLMLCAACRDQNDKPKSLTNKK